MAVVGAFGSRRAFFLGTALVALVALAVIAVFVTRRKETFAKSAATPASLGGEILLRGEASRSVPPNASVEDAWWRSLDGDAAADASCVDGVRMGLRELREASGTTVERPWVSRTGALTGSGAISSTPPAVPAGTCIAQCRADAEGCEASLPDGAYACDDLRRACEAVCTQNGNFV
jgi:hypothetical protein